MSTALLVLLLLGTDPQPAPGAPVPTEQQALALELVKLVQPEPAYRSGLEQMMEQLVAPDEAQARASGKPLPADYRQRMSAVLLEVVPYEEMAEWSAGIYATRFTVSELKDLLAFYRTPLGRKLASKLPEIMGEVGKRITVVIPERLPTALRHHGLLPDPSQRPPERPVKPGKEQKL